MLIPSVRDRAAFDAARFTATLLGKTPHSQTRVIGLEAGQMIPVHHPGCDLTLLILEGQATLVAGDADLAKAGPGALLVAPAGEARGLRADVRTVALAVQSPPPNEADHREIVEHFQRGTWR